MKKSDVLSALKGRSLLRDVDLTKDEFLGLIDLSTKLRDEKRSGTEKKMLKGKNIALIFEKASTRVVEAVTGPAASAVPSSPKRSPKR